FAVLPAGYVPGPPARNDGVFIALLPYVEQDSVYKLWKFKPAGTQNWGTVATATTTGPASNVVKTYQCPTGSRAPAFPYENFESHNLGLTCYLANAGTRSYPTEAKDGIFFGNSKIRFQDIVDGTSNTLLFGERNYRQPAVNDCTLNTLDWGAWGAASGVIY